MYAGQGLRTKIIINRERSCPVLSVTPMSSVGSQARFVPEYAPKGGSAAS